MNTTDQLAKTDMLDTNKVDPNDVSVLVVVRHKGTVTSYEGHAEDVTYTEELEEPRNPWCHIYRRTIRIVFNNEDIIQRVVKE